MTSPVVLTTDIPGLPRHATGKVRDVYRVGGDALLLVASDRISAFDMVLRQGIPDKGRVLTQLSAFWFAETAHLLPNHLITANDADIAERIERETGEPVSPAVREMLAGRAMLCKRTTPLPIEAVVRGYLSGSGWKAYQTAPHTSSGDVDLWGVTVPAALRESDRLPTPIFTPSTKASEGHDMPLPQSQIEQTIGNFAQPVQAAALALYEFADEYAMARGIVLADTKFEFGTVPLSSPADFELLLIDEALTPDSSRFWDASLYAPGGPQPSWDKQFVRDYLLSVPNWNQMPPAPDLPDAIVEKTAEKYRDAYRRLVGRDLP